jgi:hypothetical protein
MRVMNAQILKQYLTTFKKWFKANKVQAAIEQEEREDIAAHIQSYNKEKLLNMSEEDCGLWQCGEISTTK